MQNYQDKLVESSRRLADILLEDIGSEPDRFLEMYSLAVRDEYPLSMRASGILAKAAIHNADTVKKIAPDIVAKLGQFKTDGVKRGLLKILIEVPCELDEDSIGLLADITCNWIKDTNESIAVRAYSMDIFYRFVQQYPDLAKEFVAILEEVGIEGSAGIKGRCEFYIAKTKKEFRGVFE